MTEEGCMLCDTRDLAHCSLVCKSWTLEAQKAIYHNVRLDAVHYCQREDELSEKRRRKSSLFDRNGDPRDPAQQRLQLFATAVRANSYLGSLVEILKVPYMTREACQADLARAISALPNLRYVDLPEGLFSDEPSFLTLREELRYICGDLRRMKYTKGAEASFEILAQTRLWPNLEVLELSGLAIEPDVLLYGLASFPALHEVKLQNMECLNDDVFNINPSTPIFPPIPKLVLEGPGLTAAGLVKYLSRPAVPEILSNLTIIDTSIQIQDLYTILVSATHLTDLTIRQTVTNSLPLSPIPPLKSTSLTTLYFEILPKTTATTTNSHSSVESYYTYLATSLLSSSLPNLTSLFTYYPPLPTLLLDDSTLPSISTSFTNLSLSFDPAPTQKDSAPPPTQQHSAHPPPSQRSSFLPPRSSFLSPNNPPSDRHHPTPIPPSSALSSLQKPLTLYTKPPAAPELEWSVTTIMPPSVAEGRKGSMSATRPMSVAATEYGGVSPYSTGGGNGGGPGSGGTGGGGGGGFLTVPGLNQDGLATGIGDKERERRASGVAFGEVVGGFRASYFGGLAGGGDGRRGSRSSEGHGNGSGSGNVHGHGHGGNGNGRGVGEWMGSE
ncbi:hypothetical protein MMC10_009976 [Thelotrema lepadinum]|nr:hypothetical protein [Thelotrema lepadinum]